MIFLVMNDTYTYIAESEVDVCHKIKQDLLKFKITPDSKDEKLAILYQTPKFHKNPPKMPYNAENVGTVLSELDSKVAKILKMCKGHFKNLCGKYKEYTGIRYCFDVETSMEVKGMFDGLHCRAASITINDFLTLYTLFDHGHLQGNIFWLLSKLGKNRGMGYISLGYKGAWWTARDSSKFETYSVREVMEMIEYLVKNTYIRALGISLGKIGI